MSSPFLKRESTRTAGQLRYKQREQSRIKENAHRREFLYTAYYESIFDANYRELNIAEFLSIKSRPLRRLTLLPINVS